MHPVRLMAVLTTSAAGCAAIADFSGQYAPEQWTFDAGPGGTLVKHSADTLVFQDGDLGFAGPTDIVVVAAATGIWSFDWSFTAPNSTCFDSPYYLINEKAVYLVCIDSGHTAEGSVRVNVEAGDVIGYRITADDGIFGPGTMTITNFIAPLPSPPLLAMLGCAAFVNRRTRRG
jgi:hypothetical protein